MCVFLRVTLLKKIVLSRFLDSIHTVGLPYQVYCLFFRPHDPKSERNFPISTYKKILASPVFV